MARIKIEFFHPVKMELSGDQEFRKVKIAEKLIFFCGAIPPFLLMSMRHIFCVTFFAFSFSALRCKNSRIDIDWKRKVIVLFSGLFHWKMLFSMLKRPLEKTNLFLEKKISSLASKIKSNSYKFFCLVSWFDAREFLFPKQVLKYRRQLAKRIDRNRARL